jgi:HSP20 family protein
MTLLRRSPTRDIVNLRDNLDRFFDERFFTPILSPLWETDTMGAIPLDIIEEGNDIRVKASVPGIKPQDLHVEVVDDQLHIWGEVKQDKEREDKDYYMREHRYGRIERMVTLPYPVNSDKAKAEFKDGMLTLTLPKTAEVMRKEIKIVS